MTIPQSLPTFYDSYSYVSKGIKDTASTSIEGVKKVALPIITFLGEVGSSGANGVKHIFHAGVEKISNFISLINKLVKRLFFSEEVKIDPIRNEPPKTTLEAPIAKETENTIPDYEDHHFEPPMLTEMQRKQIFADVKSNLNTILEEINTFITTKTPSESEKEEFLANLRIEFNSISDKIDFAIDPVTKNIEELIAPKEMVFEQIELIVRSFFKKTGELIVQYSPTTEERSQMIATTKIQLDATLEKLITAAKKSDGTGALKVLGSSLDFVDSGDIY